MLLDIEEYLTLTGETTADEDALTPVIEAASDVIEAQLGRKLPLQQRTEKHRARPALLLKAWPVAEITSVTQAGKPVRGWELEADEGILHLPEGIAPGWITVEYTGGFAEIPAAVRQAVALTVQALRKSMDTDGQALMSERLGDYQMMYYQGETGAERAISATAMLLIRPYMDRRVIR